MSELQEEQESGLFDIQYLLDVVRRRHIQFLIPLFVGWFIVWGVSWLLPVSYRSNTMILVQEPTMPKDYVLPNVNDDLQDRLQSISQEILSRTRLLYIIDQLNLYKGGKGKSMSPEDKVHRMQKDIDISLVRDPRENTITAFNISYSSPNPRLAQQVTGELAKLYINANQEARQQESEGTTKFLESQLESARSNLSDQEGKVREFKGSHLGALQEQQAGNLQILSGLQSQLTNEQNALNTAQQQHAYLQTMMNQYRATQGTTKTVDGTPTRLPLVEQELEKERSQLADLSSRYTDSYPDIRSLKSQIAKTEKVRDALIAEIRKSNAANQSGSTANTQEPIDPSSPMLQVQGQLQLNSGEIKNREQNIAELKARIGEYQGRLNQEPATEQQMADLTRGYEQSKENYDDLLKKKNQSAMATSMESLRQGERFVVLDAPSLPAKPDFPNRMKFCGMGIGLGLALGLLIAGGLEFLDDRMHSEKEIKNLIPAVLIAEIPDIVSQSVLDNHKRKMFLGWSVATVVFLVILTGTAFNYLHS